MFRIIASLTSLIVGQKQGREALIDEDLHRTEQGFSTNRIYRESSADRRARKELASIRYRERLYEQIKFVRLMKKLLIKASSSEESDEELEQMRLKVAQLELKIRKVAERTKDIHCEDMFNLNKPDDEYDIQLEEFIRTTVSNTSTMDNHPSKFDEKASGDYVSLQKTHHRFDSSEQEKQ